MNVVGHGIDPVDIAKIRRRIENSRDPQIPRAIASWDITGPCSCHFMESGCFLASANPAQDDPGQVDSRVLIGSLGQEGGRGTAPATAPSLAKGWPRTTGKDSSSISVSPRSP